MHQGCLTSTRDEVLEDLRRRPHTTFCVIGGGVHGAAAARLAARNGCSTTLLERSDYAAATSSRSSKMAHGGLRYLEMLDFQQVSEGIQARNDLFLTARHLCRPARFLVPVPRGDWWTRLKLGVGMTLYDLMGTERSQRHRFLPNTQLMHTGFHEGSRNLAGCYEYTDGLIQDDARLVLESVLDARAHAARCLNYMEAVSVTKTGSGYSVVCRDRFGSGDIELTADLVINCAGPWAPWIASSDGEKPASRIRYSVGIHLLFDRPWTGPSLFLPMAERGRYYFVWPHAGGTMVGTTEREVDHADYDPIPTSAEVEEILARLARDLPEAGLDRTTLYHGFSGVRTLPLRGAARGTARLSRKHLWLWTESGLTLLGGKLTTANWTAWEGFRMAAEHLGMHGSQQSLKGAAYPGSGTEEQLLELESELTERGMPPIEAARLTARYGLRARFLLSAAEYTDPIAPRLYRGEVELALREEQCMTAEDLLRRRTGIEHLPGELSGTIDAATPFLARTRDAGSIEAEASAYRRRLENLKSALGCGSVLDRSLQNGQDLSTEVLSARCAGS